MNAAILARGTCRSSSSAPPLLLRWWWPLSLDTVNARGGAQAVAVAHHRVVLREFSSAASFSFSSASVPSAPPPLPSPPEEAGRGAERRGPRAQQWRRRQLRPHRARPDAPARSRQRRREESAAAAANAAHCSEPAASKPHHRHHHRHRRRPPPKALTEQRRILNLTTRLLSAANTPTGSLTTPLIQALHECAFWHVHRGKNYEGTHVADLLLRRLVEERLWWDGERRRDDGRAGGDGDGTTNGKNRKKNREVSIATDAVHAVLDSWRILSGPASARAEPRSRRARGGGGSDRRGGGAGEERPMRGRRRSGPGNSVVLAELKPEDRARSLLDLLRSAFVELPEGEDRGEGGGTSQRDGERRRVEGSLSSSLRRQQRLPSSSSILTSKSYNMVIDAYARSRRPHDALDVLETHPSPNVVSYNSVLKAWAQSGLAGSADEAERLLVRMEEEGEGPRPNDVSYSSVVSALSSDPRCRGDGEVGRRAEGVMRRMLLRGRASPKASGRGGERQEEWEYKDVMDDGAVVRPSVVAFAGVIAAWAKSGSADAGRRAEGILRWMEGEGAAPISGINIEMPRVRPNTVCYNAAIDAWAKSGTKGGEGAERAEAILERMLTLSEGGWGDNDNDDNDNDDDVRPNTISFSAVIDAWARSGVPESARRAETILERMEDLYRDGYDADVRPNTVSYSSVLFAYARASHYERGAYRGAERVFRRMLELEGSGDDDRVRTTVVTYNAYLNALAKSSVPDKAARARALLLDMEEKHARGESSIRPDLFTFNAVLQACARTVVDDDHDETKRRFLLTIAVETLDMLRERVGPSHHSYDSFFSACGKFAAAAPASTTSEEECEYAELVGRAFRLCCEDGVLDDVTLRNLRRSAPAAVFNELLEGCSTSQHISTKDLPSDWSRNVKERHWKR